MHDDPAAANNSSLADFWLRKTLEAELSVLKDSDTRDLAKVEALRSWVCRNVTRAPRSSPLQLDARKAGDWRQRSPAWLLRLFAERRAAVMCGGTAHVLLKVFRLFGFDGFVYGFGEPESTLTHVVTVVRVERNGRPIFSVQDAYFNCTVVDKAAEPVDFFELLQRLRLERHLELRIVHDMDAEHDYLPSAQSLPDRVAATSETGQPGTTASHPSVVRKRPNLEQWVMSKPIESLAPGFAYPANFLDLYTRPMSFRLGRWTATWLRHRLRSAFPGTPVQAVEAIAGDADEGAETAAFWFRRTLRNRYPVLADPRARDVDKAHALRTFVFHHVNRSPRDPVLQLPERWGNAYYSRSAPELFRAFLSREGSAMCHGNAYALVRVCEMLGLPAFVYNMGMPEAQFTHAVAVVTVRDGDGTKEIVEDSHLGMTIEDLDAGPVDFFDMLAHLRDRRHENLRMRFENDLTTPFIAPVGHQIVPGEVLETILSEPLEEGRLLYRQKADLALWCRRRKMPRLMRERGLPPVFLYLYTMPQGVFAGGGSDSPEACAIKDRIECTLLGKPAKLPASVKAE